VNLLSNKSQTPIKKQKKKRKELQRFIERFSANAAKSKQATSRKKLLAKLTLEDIKPSSRRYPYVNFEQSREAGNDLLDVDKLTKSIDHKLMFQDFSLYVKKGQKIAFLGKNDLVMTTLFRILMGEIEPDSGTFKWGVSTNRAYFPKNNAEYFNKDMNLIDWLRQYSEMKEEDFIRGWLGRMLFGRDDVAKKVSVLSGGEKVRCLLAKMMLTQPNVVVLDEPTNHLDLESITSLNKGLIQFKGTVLFTSHDHQFIQTVANRIIEITPNGFIDRHHTTLDEYLENPEVKELREALYQKTTSPSS